MTTIATSPATTPPPWAGRPEAELALLARSLHSDGYAEHNNGHISYAQPDGSLLVTPRGFAWDEIRASDIMRVTRSGEVIDGHWEVSPALELHYVLHQQRSVVVAVHHHPEYATVWACSRRLPPIYDQMSAYLGCPLVTVDEYAGEVFDQQSAEETVSALGDGDAALLGHHGVLVLGGSIKHAHQRAVALEWRARLAWRLECLGLDNAVALPESAVASLAASINARGGYLPTLFDSMARREVRRDAAVLE